MSSSTANKKVILANRRNIGIVAHIDAGKTTATERILHYSGLEHRLGEVHEGTTVTDYMPEERDRGITITSAAVTVPWKEYTINIIDTPGHVDFTAEVERSLRVLDGAVMIFCGVAGVQSQSETVWRQADHYHVPRIAFINKMDRVGADFDRAMQSIEDRLGAVPVEIQIPTAAEDKFSDIIDLVAMELVYHEPDDELGVNPKRKPIPDEFMDVAMLHRQRMLELVAERDEEMLDLFADDQEPEPAQLRAAIRRILTAQATDDKTEGILVPVLCGSAFKNRGIQILTDAICDYLPAPREVPVPPATHPETNEPVDVKVKPSAPFSALAFKTISDKHGDLTFLRIYSGTLTQGMRVQNTRQNRKERIQHIYRLYADSREMLDSASAGDIVGVVGLKFCVTGDTLCDPAHPVLFEKMLFPETVIDLAIEPKSNADKDKLGRSLNQLAKEDPTFRHHYNEETGQLIISGMGELHLDILTTRLLREFNVNARVGSPRVSYREMIAQPMEATGEFVHQSGGRGQYGVVKLRVEPIESDDPSRIVVESKIRDGSIPKDFIPSVETGILDAASSGVMSAFPVINATVTILDGKYHEIDSTTIAFENAASIAFKNACRQAGMYLMEPIMELVVETPEEYLGNLVKDLNSRRATVSEISRKGVLQTITVRAPLAALFGYATDSRSLSQGRATYTMRPASFDRVPRNLVEKAIGWIPDELA